MRLGHRGKQTIKREDDSLLLAIPAPLLTENEVRAVWKYKN